MRAIFFLVVLGGCVIGDGTDAQPIRFAAGAPQAVDFEPGRVVHDVCIAVDDTTGYIKPVLLIDDGTMGPGEGAPVFAAPIADLDCPDEPDWTGWARIEWRTASGRGAAAVEHAEASAPAGTPDVTGVPASEGPAGEILFAGERFPGYEVVVEEPTQTGPALTVPISVAYRDAGALAGRPGDGLTLTLSLLPSGPVIVGSSTGGPEDPIVTDFEGRAFVFFDAVSLDCLVSEEYAVFVTPTGGGTTLVGTLAWTF
ncbi:MAG: hypothetical protein L0227_10680 [Chloroflexi bacterium]|nr:hypothetical protein [Chloroflexota bacterium]